MEQILQRSADENAVSRGPQEPNSEFLREQRLSIPYISAGNDAADHSHHKPQESVLHGPCCDRVQCAATAPTLFHQETLSPHLERAGLWLPSANRMWQEGCASSRDLAAFAIVPLALGALSWGYH